MHRSTPLSRPSTSVGVDTAPTLGSPSPIAPRVSLPQHLTPPVCSKAHECQLPAEIYSTPLDNPTTGAVITAAKNKLAGFLRGAGLYALKFAARTGAPGSSFHVGGTLPMSNTSTELETDRYGRLHGLERVYVVDASVLPTIPATTITFSVMANAHRIGTLS